ncbi:MAG: translation elongation factor Ts [Firmicutes bacterium]|nr:translation elongation factor Ts [Bacillota bacterium]
MAFTAKDVAALREQTGAGMMDCKKALTECGGDMAKATEFLRERGISIAGGKGDRVASEGVVAAFVSDDSTIGALAEVNSESDFVSRSDEFLLLSNKIAKHIAMNNPKDVETALAQTFVDDKKSTINDLVIQGTAKIGEKLSFRRFSYMTNKSGVIESYIHMGGKIGVLIDIACDKKVDKKALPVIKGMAKDISMHIAAFDPKYIDESAVPSSEIEYEKGILKAQIVNDPKAKGKPGNVIEKMIEGRISKYLKEICLIHQDFAKDPSKTITVLLQEQSKSLGINLSIARFTRFTMGEGLEKKVDNLAEEVAKLSK